MKSSFLSNLSFTFFLADILPEVASKKVEIFGDVLNFLIDVFYPFFRLILGELHWKEELGLRMLISED
jgi:hypothetical protein